MGALLEMCRDTQPWKRAVCHPLMSGPFGVSITLGKFKTLLSRTWDQTATTAGSSFHPLKTEWREFNSIILFHFHPDMGDKRDHFTL